MTDEKKQEDAARAARAEKRRRRDKTRKDQMGQDRLAESAGPQPAVILVAPQMGENIGAAARAMLNFGLTDLRIVKPRDGWPNERAYALASGAAPLLDNAKLFETTEEAVADLSFIMAATARRRELEIPVIGTGEVGPQLVKCQRGGIASGIMFGPEQSGLTNDDVVLCDYILTYPINPAFQSLNLAQAVAVFSYIWGSRESTAPPDFFDKGEPLPAPRKDLTRMLEHLEDELEKAGFFYPPQKTPLMKNNIRAPLIRGQLTEQEVRTFRGMIKALAKGRGAARK
ncbi:RNA methyltransferase [Robiginitomaculum antarcticum]|uniref:RNA methyltransferase n=1 Tax=Robiginitomaculum antarcticum TaxID=437507 RepID=UPI0003666398|nr:RNA methyltransferase [Robiginitomaculum antarcticum]